MRIQNISFSTCFVHNEETCTKRPKTVDVSLIEFELKFFLMTISFDTRYISIFSPFQQFYAPRYNIYA